MKNDSIYALLLLLICIFIYNTFDLFIIFSISLFKTVCIIFFILCICFFVSKKFKYFCKNIGAFWLDSLMMFLISIILWFFCYFKELSVLDLLSIYWLLQNTERLIIIDINYLLCLLYSRICTSIMFFIAWLFFLVLLLPGDDN